MMEKETSDAIHKSMKRCNHHPRFFDIFYEKFLSSSPDVRTLFANTNWKRQKRALEASLYMSMLVADEVPYAISSIEHLGHTHNDMHIERGHYDLWLDCLMEAVSACDDQFDEELERQWRAMMTDIIEMMVAPQTSSTPADSTTA